MQNDLFLNEKQLISASRASEETGYSSDYIGQLARSKKIPAKLVARTWFVDIESLRAHKSTQKENKSKKARNNFFASSQKTKNSIANTEYLGYPSSGASTPTLKYEAENLVKLPEILKQRELVSAKAFSGITQRKPVKSNHRVLTLTAGVVILAGVIFAQSGVDLAPKVASDLNNTLKSLESVNEGIVAGLIHVKDSLLALVGGASTTTEGNNQGVVIFQDGANRDERVAQVKSNFSDDVNVIFDQSGTSGVVTPVFRGGAADENYAFVLVPIKSQQ